jgi:nucleoside-diphosphate-sugar epimerase
METLDFGIQPDVAENGYIVNTNERILVTGANGYIGSKLVHMLLSYGFTNIRCLTRSTSTSRLATVTKEFGRESIEIVKGNLLSRDDCMIVAEGASVIYHLAAGMEKTFPGCFLNSVVTTRNLLDAVIAHQTLKRFVNVSSFAVYTNEKIARGGLLDELCEVASDLVERYDPYAYGKAKQDELVLEYTHTKHLPSVIVRPAVVFGPGKARIHDRIGIDTFGVFLHLGLNNRIPLTYIDNCAEAIALAGLRKGIEGEVINIVDDDLPRSRDFLRMYKKHVNRFVSIPVPYPVFYLFNFLWEKYSAWSDGQLPPAFNRKACAAYYRHIRYSNKKAKDLLGWEPRLQMDEALQKFFSYFREVRGVR